MPQEDSAVSTTDSGSQIDQQNSLSDSISPRPSAEPSPVDVIQASPPRRSCRADSGKLHRIRHGILSREVLNVLVQMGENRRSLRQLEKEVRAALRPSNPVGNLLFDRFWVTSEGLVIAIVEAYAVTIARATTPTQRIIEDLFA